MNLIKYLLPALVAVLLAACSSVPMNADHVDAAMAGKALANECKQANTLGDTLVPGRPNIILMYGFLGVPTGMLTMKTNMECHGWNVVIPDLGWNVNGTSETSKRLIEFLKKQDATLHERYGIGLADMKDDLVLFGVSRGGLAIVNAQRIDRSLLPLRVVTAGSAFGGIPLGILISPLSEAARDTFPGSQFLQDLREDMKTHPRTLLQVTATIDWLVPEYIVPGYPHYRAPIIGHLSLGSDLDHKIFESMLPKYFETKIPLVN